MEWRQRPDEEAYLLNPAFLATLLHATAHAFRSVENEPMPVLLAYLAMPVVLHKPTRDLLPGRTTASLVNWLDDHPEARLLLADRAASLVPFVREGLAFGVAHGVLNVDAGLNLEAGRRARGGLTQLLNSSADYASCFRAAAVMGKWMARSGSVPTQMALWGVKP